MSSEEVEDLNYDFNYNLFLAKTCLTNMTKAGDKERVTRWMRKLSQCGRSIEELKLRNDFMYYLIVNIQHGELMAPFNERPPDKPLPSIAHLLPGGGQTVSEEDAFEEAQKDPDAHRPLLYEKSPDGGAFLAAQPIPKCGAFCYLAVVARKPEQ